MGSLYSNAAFMRLFLGRFVTNAGDSMYSIAAMWLVYDLTGSPFYTGLAGFLVRVPSSLQFLVGPLVDRWSLRWLLVSTQFIQGICVLAIPIAAATGHLSVWLVILLMPVLTFLNQFVYPAQVATLPRIIEEDQLVRANSLFSFAYQGVNMVFNAASGVLIAIIGAVALYLVDAVTFGIAFLLFLGLTIPDETTARSEDDEDGDDRRYLVKLREGFSYIYGSAILAMLLGAVLANFAYGLIIAVLPAFAASLGGPEVYGLLTAAMAAGTLAGAVIASVVEDYPYGWITIVGYLVSAASWFAALVVPWLPATIAFFFVAFVPIGTNNVILASMLQSAVDNALLGRVSAVISSISTVMLPIGSLLGGLIASAFGIMTALSGMVAALAFLSIYFLVRPRLRTLPPVAEADEVALGLG